jgi:NADH dehydrogenase
MRGADAVINLVGILDERRPGRQDNPRKRRGDFHDTHVELPRRVVKMARKLGVRRVQHMSANGADPLGPSSYLRSKGLGARIVREAGETPNTGLTPYLDGPKLTRPESLAVTVFEPSIIFGEGDHFFSDFARLVRLPGPFPLPRAETRFQPVWVEDVAEAYVRTLADPKAFGRTYRLCGPHAYTFADLVRFTAEVQGRHKRIWPLPDTLGLAQAWLLEHMPGRPMTRDQFATLLKDNVCTGEAFPAELDIEPQSLEAVVPEYLGGVESVSEELYRFRATARRD